MEPLPLISTAAVAILAAFLVALTVIKYAVHSAFSRTRAIMTLFFLFIVATLTLAFWPFAVATLPFSIPAFALGCVIGYLFGVRAAEEKLSMQGIEHYMEHFAHIHVRELSRLTWWSVVNFYSIMGALVLINLIGFSTVFNRGEELWADITSATGAFLLGTIAPYLIHLWTIKKRHARSKTTSE